MKRKIIISKTEKIEIICKKLLTLFRFVQKSLESIDEFTKEYLDSFRHLNWNLNIR